MYEKSNCHVSHCLYGDDRLTAAVRAAQENHRKQWPAVTDRT